MQSQTAVYRVFIKAFIFMLNEKSGLKINYVFKKTLMLGGIGGRRRRG